MTWNERTGIILLAATFTGGYLLGMYGRWQERVRARRGRRLVERLGWEMAERLGRERGGW